MAFGWLLISSHGAHGLLRCRQDVRRVLLGPIVGLFVLWVTIMLSGSWAYTRFGLFALPAVVVALAHSLVHLLPSGRLLVLALQMYPLGLVVLVDKQPGVKPCSGPWDTPNRPPWLLDSAGKSLGCTPGPETWTSACVVFQTGISMPT